ncbi:uncharacterized protein ACNLHF_018600 [Anomaloglossus baeobatrachus]|uniref:uncharacterized protein LOC142311199 n=1 Tax=Anomaloglossus baeobatrachus TaxID=238106 RepID=UPI003F504A99
MEKEKSAITEQIFYHIMEILYLLTGEDYIIVKKPGRQTTHSKKLLIVEGICRTLGNVLLTPSQSVTSKEDNKKILHLTNKIIQLLTREVPIRCEDVTVHFSVEEWEYIEGHKDLYKDIVMEKLQNIELLDDPICKNGLLHNGTSDLLKEDDMTMQAESGRESLKIHNLGVMQNIFSGTITEKVSACKDGRIDHTNSSSLDIKEEPCDVSCDGGNLPNPQSAVQFHSDHIKEEPVSYDDHHANSSSSTDHTQHHPSHAMEEQSSCVEPRPNMYTSTVHTQHHRYPHIMKELSTYDGKNFTQPNTYTPIDPSQYPSTHNIEKTVTCERGNHTNTGLKRKYPSLHNMEEPASSNKAPVAVSCKDHIDLKTPSYPIQQSTSSLVEQKKPACNKRKLKNIALSSSGSEDLQTDVDDDKNNSSSVYSVRQSNNAMEILYHCPSCQKGFYSNLDLARHQVTHTVDKHFKCTSCGKSFTELSFLVKHQVIHTDLKLCVCQVCGACFYSETSLAKHQKTHSSPEHCSICGKCFFSKAELEVHKTRHVGEKPYACHVCGKHFVSKFILEKHAICHSKVELSK